MLVSAVPPVVPRRGPAVNEFPHVPAASPPGPSVPIAPISSSSASAVGGCRPGRRCCAAARAGAGLVERIFDRQPAEDADHRRPGCDRSAGGNGDAAAGGQGIHIVGRKQVGAQLARIDHEAHLAVGVARRIGHGDRGDVRVRVRGIGDDDIVTRCNSRRGIDHQAGSRCLRCRRTDVTDVGDGA